MQRRTVFAVMAAAGAAVIVAGGCRYDQPGPGRAGTTVDGRQQTTHREDAQHLRHERRTQERVFGIPEMTFPGGDDHGGIVRISAASNQDEVRVGQPFVYRLSVTNLSDELMLEDVTVHQDLPESVQIAGVRPEGLAQGQRPGEWVIGSLAPGQTREFEVAVVPQEEGQFESCLRVSYNPVLCTTISVVAPNLQLIQEMPARVLVCEPIPVRYLIANTGSGSTAPVIIRASLPEGIVGPDGPGTITIPVGRLGPGEQQRFSVNLAAQRTGELTLPAMAVTEDGMEVRAEAPPQPTIIWAPNLDVQIQGPEMEFMERPIEYIAIIRNGGDGPALNTQLHLDFQGQARLVSASHPMRTGPGAQQRGPGRDGPMPRGNIISLGDIPPGEGTEVRFILESREPGSIQVAALATALCAEQPAQRIVTEVRGITSLLLELVDTNDPIRIGEHEVYRIAVTNQGNIADQNVQIMANLPQGFEVVDIQGPTPGRVEGNQITFAPVDTLPAGRRATWTVTVIAREPGDHRFAVQLTSDALEQPVTANEATRAY
jgi:uncharacterized repeat protein (TIGR01451 family)